MIITRLKRKRIAPAHTIDIEFSVRIFKIYAFNLFCDPLTHFYLPFYINARLRLYA